MLILFYIILSYCIHLVHKSCNLLKKILLNAVTTILGIFTAINEHIIETAPTQTLTGSAEPNSFPYSLCLSALKDLETLVEVVAIQYYGEEKKWNFLAVTEASK